MFAKTAKQEPVMEVALAFVDAVNRQDLIELGKLMSKNHMFVDSLGVLVEGREKMLAGWADYLRMAPDYMVSIEETPAAWRATVVEWPG